MANSSTRQFAVVTGASSGIGFELAKQFAEHDFDVLIVADGDGIHTAARELEGLGVNAKPVQLDLTAHDGGRLGNQIVQAQPLQGRCREGYRAVSQYQR